MRYIAIFLVLFSVGCSSKKEYVYRDHIIDNTEIRHTKETVFKGSKSTTIVPCKEINQVVELGNTTVTIKSVPEDPEEGWLTDMEVGNVVIDIDQADFILTDSVSVTDNSESLTERSKEIVYKKYIPKWVLYLLVSSLSPLLLLLLLVSI